VTRQGLLFVVLIAALSGARETALAQARSPGEKTVRVFVDCDAMGCDLDFFRTEIPYVDYVRDRADATVHVLISTQQTGGGGTEHTLNFIGLRNFAGLTDTLVYVAPQSATQDDRRKGLARTMKLGLVRYIARTPLGVQLQVSREGPSATTATPAVARRDPWNFWVFQTRASGNFSGESSQSFISLYGSVSANRVTKGWKVNNSVNVSYSESNFTLSDDEKLASYSRSYGVSELIVKSLGEHWSAGQRASLTSSTFLNSRRALRFAPAIEYDVFPYSSSTRKLLTFQYSLGVVSYLYHDTTIFDKLSEVRPNQTLSAAITATQPWGSVSGSIEGATFLDDFSKRHLVLFNSVNARLFKGFSFNMFGSFSLLRDQIYLSKGGATEEEILLRRRQLATSYSYFAGVGLTYTFGSIFNNVVNPRFEGASGTFFF
jgi:hypothetical protein